MEFFFYKKDVVVKVYAITLHQVSVTKVKVIAGLMHSSCLDHISLFKSVKWHWTKFEGQKWSSYSKGPISVAYYMTLKSDVKVKALWFLQRYIHLKNLMTLMFSTNICHHALFISMIYPESQNKLLIKIVIFHVVGLLLQRYTSQSQWRKISPL